MSRPHQCFTPAQPFWDLYRESELVLPPSADYDMTGQSPLVIAMSQRYRDKLWAKFEPQTYEASRLRRLHGYLGNISHVDHAVGQLLAWLAEQGLDRNTIVVYGSDHGDYTCEHGLMEKAPGISHDAVTRVPFIWRWLDRFQAGHVADEIVENIDLVPTLCSLAGVERLHTADGCDLAPLLLGGAGEVRSIGVTEFAWSRSVRRGNYRYVYYPKAIFAKEYPAGFGELYDLKNDHWEMRNLYFDSEHADLVCEMRDELMDWFVTTTRPRTVLGVDQRRGRESPGGTQVRVRDEVWAYQDGKLSPAALHDAAEAGRRYYL